MRFFIFGCKVNFFTIQFFFVLNARGYVFFDEQSATHNTCFGNNSWIGYIIVLMKLFGNKRFIESWMEDKQSY